MFYPEFANDDVVDAAVDILPCVNLIMSEGETLVTLPSCDSLSWQSLVTDGESQ